MRALRLGQTGKHKARQEGEGMISNYLLVSLPLILAIWMISLVFKQIQIKQEQEETIRQEN